MNQKDYPMHMQLASGKRNLFICVDGQTNLAEQLLLDEFNLLVAENERISKSAKHICNPVDLESALFPITRQYVLEVMRGEHPSDNLASRIANFLFANNFINAA